MEPERKRPERTARGSANIGRGREDERADETGLGRRAQQEKQPQAIKGG